MTDIPKPPEPPEPEETPTEWLEKETELKQALQDLKNSGKMNFAKARELNKQLREHRRKR